MNNKLPDLIANPILKAALLLATCFFSANANAQCCHYTLSMYDTYGDGWNGATLEVLINHQSVGVFSASNAVSAVPLSVCNGDTLDLMYTAGDYENENSYTLQDSTWNIVFQDGPTPATGAVFSTIGDCNTPLLPGSHPCTAIPLDSSLCITADNTGFPGAGLVPCANYQGGDIWFTMQVPASGNLSLETSNGNLTDTGIAVWTDTSCTTLHLLGCDDDAGAGYYSYLLLYDLTPGQTIYIQVWGWGGGAGTFNLCARDLGTVVLDSSELPIVMINTLGKTIGSETKVDCLMDIKYNGPNNITYVTDSANVYSGNIGIEIRGQTSASFPQLPFGFETRTATGDNNDVSLLGMPEENDWVLLSNYNDRSLLRNLMAYKFFGDMGHYSVRAQLCEVLIDSSYNGIYVFGEKIKRDNQRVDIATLTTTDTLGDDLTGGYILQQNYWNDDNSFLSNYSPIDHPDFDVHFVYEYPDPATILPVQKAYIAAYVDSLETALYSSNFSDPATGYREYLDVKSFIDYFLVNEVSRNSDGFKKSVFFHKDKNSNGGKLKAGPVWDFDWAFKNQDYCQFSSLEGAGWAHRINDCFTDNYSAGWYIRLLQDSTFNNELRCTYEDYRHTILDTARIFSYIDSVEALVQHAQARHFRKWPILGRTGPDSELEPVAATYHGELDTLKSWITKRLQWLDDSIPGLCVLTGVHEWKKHDLFHCYPNPAMDHLTVDYSLSSPQKVAIRMFNIVGTAVVSMNQEAQSAGQHTLTIETASLSPGIYLLSFETESRVTTQKIVITK